MFKISLYLLGGSMFFIIGGVFFISGFYFLFYDYTIFLDWEFLTLSSCSMTLILLFDWMSLAFVGSVFIISSMVIYYSNNYMYGDVHSVRFYFLVVLFVFSMFMMIISPNLISILIGWDGLGLVSYCLVIYFQNCKSYTAGMLTILTNRIGDAAILISIAWMLNFGSWNYVYCMDLLNYWGLFFIILISLAGFTSSAQIPFSSWLPAAMAAPTPVSSLVHSSTLVTAGVYLLIRFSNIFLSFDCSFLLLLSMMTMFLSGIWANFEYDLKKIIALSTLSQLGLMMSIIFIGFPILSFFHLLAHAFFKALLFLCAGVMIHCMSNVQDIRYMGMMSNQLPFTLTCFCIANLSLCGLPFMSGFYSKDMILEMMFISYFNFFVGFIFLISVGLTASYSIRLVFYCLSFNKNLFVCNDYFEDKSMGVSMILLTFLSIFGGSLLSWLMFKDFIFVVLPFYLKVLPLIIVILGGMFGYELCYMDIYGYVYFFNFYMFNFFSGLMLFMPLFSMSLYKYFLTLSSSYYGLFDNGWGEYVVSYSPLNYSSYLGKIFLFYQINNISIFMGVFMLIFVVFLF